MESREHEFRPLERQQGLDLGVQSLVGCWGKCRPVGEKWGRTGRRTHRPARARLAYPFFRTTANLFSFPRYLSSRTSVTFGRIGTEYSAASVRRRATTLEAEDRCLIASKALWGVGRSVDWTIITPTHSRGKMRWQFHS